MTELLIGNWEYVLLGFMVAEKIVKLTPTKYDDILFDMTKDVIFKMAGKKGVDSDE
jgi:hypothetical protein